MQAWDKRATVHCISYGATVDKCSYVQPIEFEQQISSPKQTKSTKLSTIIKKWSSAVRRGIMARKGWSHLVVDTLGVKLLPKIASLSVPAAVHEIQIIRLTLWPTRAAVGPSLNKAVTSPIWSHRVHGFFQHFRHICRVIEINFIWYKHGHTSRCRLHGCPARSSCRRKIRD
jgi:hypothetical protein